MQPTVPLATVHKARLQWLDATDDMLAESRAFLFDHGYEGLNIRAYTSKTRDAARAKLGFAPLPSAAPTTLHAIHGAMAIAR